MVNGGTVLPENFLPVHSLLSDLMRTKISARNVEQSAVMSMTTKGLHHGRRAQQLISTATLHLDGYDQ